MPLPSRAAVISVNPTADAFVAASAPDSNYGSAGALGLAPAAAAKGQFQSVLKFDLSAIKSGFDTTLGTGNWTVQDVSLQLSTSNPSNNPLFNTNAPGNFSVSLMSDPSWIEGTGTPNAPATNGITFTTLSGFTSAADPLLGTYAFAGGTSGSASYDLPLAAALAADISAGGTAALRLFAADANIAYLFSSRNFGTASSRPLLSITATAPAPEPTGAAAAAIGLAILSLLARRPRHA